MDDTLPVIDGLRVIARTDESGPGEVWRSRVVGGLGGASGQRLPGELAGVGECDVRLLRLPVEEAIRSRAHAVAAELLTLEDGGLVGVREVRVAYDGVALVLSPLPSPMLGLHLLARRRQLSAGEVVTLGVALAWALAAAHGAGLTHGRLRDEDVLIDPGGRPMLAGVGVMGVLGAGGEPADDVRALARMLLSLLDVESAGAAAAGQVLQQAPDSATELAASLASATPARPIRLRDDASDEELWEPTAAPRSSRRGRRRRSVLGGLVVGAIGHLPAGSLRASSGHGSSRLRNVPWRRIARHVGAGSAVVVLAGVIGWVSAPGPAASNTAALRPPTKPTPAAPNWTGVLTRLDALRADAFAHPGTIAITTFDAAGSAALRYDTAAVAALRNQGAQAKGLRMVLASVTPQARAAGEATLAVTDSRTAYDVFGAHHELLSHVGARAAASHLIVLRASTEKGGWRIAEVKAS